MNDSWQLSPFDTDIFGWKVAKINKIDTCDPQGNIRKILDEFSKKDIQYATYRLQASRFSVIHALERAGFILVDGLIALEYIIENREEVSEAVKNIREATIDDLDQLKKIAGIAFSLNRFYNDKLIPRKKADEIYIRWIINSVNKIAADNVFVWEEKSEILGFITLQKSGHIPLIAVSKHARGQGISKKLIEVAISECKKFSIAKIAIETQITNIPALRAYISSGFKVTDSFLTYRWAGKKLESSL